MYEIKNQVEHLANLMSESEPMFSDQTHVLITSSVPGKRYALTLQVMLKRFKNRKSASTSRSPKATREPHRPTNVMEPNAGGSMQAAPVPYSPVYDASFAAHPEGALPGNHTQMTPQQHAQHQHHPHHSDAENIWRGFEMTSNEQLPVWISDQTLGGNTFSQNGMDAFLLPPDYLPQAPPQIW